MQRSSLLPKIKQRRFSIRFIIASADYLICCKPWSCALHRSACLFECSMFLGRVLMVPCTLYSKLFLLACFSELQVYKLRFCCESRHKEAFVHVRRSSIHPQMHKHRRAQTFLTKSINVFVLEKQFLVWKSFKEDSDCVYGFSLVKPSYVC